MPTAQRQIRANVLHSASGAALRAGAQPYRAPLPQRGSAPEVAPRRATSAPLARPRLNLQVATIGVMLLAALLVVLVGLVYLYGYARLAREAYRRVHLREELRHERAMAQWWKERQAAISTPGYIEQRAQTLNMNLADDRQTFTLR
ncbi:MAG TPA: hypothetical protein VKT32_11190 [Chthonomonadaceae bacterium]|nr:hypothetical protein [Chthonomonadaceae bacterium]